MIHRPFAIQCFETAPASVLDVTVRFADADPPASGPALAHRLMRHFARVGARGGLSGAGIPPGLSTLVLRDWRLSGNLCAWRMDHVRIAPSARLVLENLIHWVHHEGAPVAQLTITVPPADPMCQPRSSPPGMFTPPPFQYEVGPVYEDVVVEVDFIEPVHDKGVWNAFARFAESWMYVAGASGFEVGGSFSGSLAYPAAVPDSQADRITLYFDDVAADDAAFDALLNGFHYLHDHAAPVCYVDIY